MDYCKSVSVRAGTGFPLMALLVIVLISGCQSNGNRVPVTMVGDAGERSTDTYVVQRGDTLYSIAFRYGLDYKTLAAANGISAPFTIYVDQRIRLESGAGLPAASDAAEAPRSKTPSSVRAPVPAANPAASTVQAPRIADTSVTWRWPHEGKVVAGFSLVGKVNKGIDIKGKPGESVRSTADGVVVYAGGGLRGYGKLIIVKHNDRFLSAYGYNNSLLVQEGDTVTAGQALATIGGTSGDEDLLHFEIRRDGKPEDPMRYLP